MTLLSKPIVRYRVQRIDNDGKPTKPLLWPTFVFKVRNLSKKIGPGPFYINQKGTSWEGSVALSRKEAVYRFLKHIRKGGIGSHWIMKASGGSISGRAVQVNIKIDIQNTPGNTNIDKIFTVVFSRWKGLENWGICVCKRITGTSSYSQHSYCNAIDIHGSSAQMFEISRFLVENKNELNVFTVIYNRQSWSKSSPYWHYYGGSNPHTDHVHVDCDPQGTGYPFTC